MDHRRRVKSAISRLPADRPPCAELVINDRVVRELCREEAVGFGHRRAFLEAMGLDAFCLHPAYAHVPGGRLPAPADWVFGDLDKWTGTDYFTFAVLDGPIGWGIRILGFFRLISKLTRYSQDVADLAAAVTAMNAEVMRHLAAGGVDGIIIADDIAFNKSVIASPAILRQVLFPSLSCQVEQARKLNLPVFFHSDGDLALVMDDIVKAGFDGLQCIDAAAGMDIGQVKKQYGRDLCLWGNLNPHGLCEPRSRRELEREAQSIISVAGKGGGLIFGTSSGLFEGMRLENLKFAYEAARQGL